MVAKSPSFFASYQLTNSGWSYVKGQFAEQSLPMSDNVTMTVQRTGETAAETFFVSATSIDAVFAN